MMNVKLTTLLLSLLLLVACGAQRQLPPTDQPIVLPTVETTNWPDSAQVFTVVSDASSAGYRVYEQFLIDSEAILGRKRTTGEAFTVGRTNDISGQLVLDWQDEQPRLLEGHFAVNLLTLKSNRTERDAHIRTYNLQSRQYPIATFVATGLQNFPRTYSDGETVTFGLEGELTIRNITQPVTLLVEAMLRGNQLDATATTTLRMTDFGFDPPRIINAVAANDEFDLEVTLVAVSE